MAPAPGPGDDEPEEREARSGATLTGLVALGWGDGAGFASPMLAAGGESSRGETALVGDGEEVPQLP